jgi:hypothetical protein
MAQVKRGIDLTLFLIVFGTITLPFSPVALLAGWAFRAVVRAVSSNRHVQMRAFLAFHVAIYLLLYFGVSTGWGFAQFTFEIFGTLSALLGCIGWYLVIRDMTEGADALQEPTVKPVFGGRFATMKRDLGAYHDWKRKRALRKLQRLMVILGVILIYGLFEWLLGPY